jgi:hypothetical protein
MLALSDPFQLMPAQQMESHFFFCLHQLKLALIFYLRQLIRVYWVHI